MDKEKVTEELVRQNGNQAAAVMADFAGGGGSTGGGSKVVYGGLVDLLGLPCFKPEIEWPSIYEESVALSEVLADGYALVHWTVESSGMIDAGFYIVKVTGSNPSVQLIDGVPAFTDCEAVTLDLPYWVVQQFAYIQGIHTILLDDISKESPLVEDIVSIDGSDLPELGFLVKFAHAPLLIKNVFDSTTGDQYVCVNTDVSADTEE